MNVFNFLAIVGSLGAIGSFLLGARAAALNPQTEQPLRRTAWTWRGVFTFFVFLTILAAPLSS